MVAKGRRKKKQFRVLFNGREVGTMEAESFQQCIQLLGLASCSGRRAPARRRCPGNALHGHIREDILESAERVAHGGRMSRTLEFPIIGSVHFDAEVSVPPPFTFRLVRPAA